MIISNDEQRFIQVAESMCPSICKKLLPLSKKLCTSAVEIRLRLNRPLAVVCPNITYYITSKGGLVSAPIGDSMFIVGRGDITDTFHNICNYSVYAKQKEINNGFVTMRGGHRAGICGTAVTSEDKIVNIRDITSINIRIAREHKGCAKSLAETLKVFDKGVLLCGAPCSGKTTVLRDLARLLSTDYGKNVSLIDERGELAALSSGIFQNDIGMCDVYDSYKKSKAMMQAIRSMAPDIIICDEIGSSDDIMAVEHSVNCGVTVIASVHCSSEKELKNKENIRALVKTRAFSRIVFLSDKKTPGKVVKIMGVGDVFDY